MKLASLLLGGLALIGGPALRADDLAAPSERPNCVWEHFRTARESIARLRPPEAAEMLVAILGGSQMGPGEGWFHAGEARYGWQWLAARFDRDADGKLTFEEFSVEPELIRRLDRNRDETLTADDFDWADSSQYIRDGRIWGSWFRQADTDSSGKVTRAEWDALFTKITKDKDFLAPADLREAFPLSQPARPTASSPANEGPSAWVLLQGLVRGEIGALTEGPRLNDLAPDFTLKTRDQKSEFTLSSYRGGKPVVLMFGNFTCGPFRSQSGNIEDLKRRYGDRLEFLAVYVREAHPTGGWRMESNDRVGIVIEQPRTMAERLAVAEQCSARLQLNMPLLVDELDDRVGKAYSGQPDRLYLIDRQGRVAYKSGRGPFGFKSGELEQSIIMLLLDKHQAGE